MSRMILSVLFLLSAQSYSWACAWDRDTLAEEAKGIPDVIRVITGRFERSPPLYYEMRLNRVAREIKAQPTNLALYDDAGVACDRLGRSDEAIAWMERKHQQLQRLNPRDKAVREHQYRYLANVGTFWAHRWLHDGANRNQIIEMKKARNYIAAAIKLNPDAHFGREKYQLKAMNWIIWPPLKQPTHETLPNFLGGNSYSIPKAAEAEKGLCGLIVLGAAWNSVDVFNALAAAVESNKRRAVVAYLAKLRGMELVDRGHVSLWPGAPTGKALKKLLDYEWEPMLAMGRRPEVAAQYKELRIEAEAYHAHRTAYMLERLGAGRHPDTDVTFWNDYTEPTPPAIYEPAFWKTYGVALTIIGGTLLVSAFILYIVSRKRRTPSMA